MFNNINFKNPIVKNIAIGGAVITYISVGMAISSIIVKATLAAVDGITSSIDKYIDERVKADNNQIKENNESDE